MKRGPSRARWGGSVAVQTLVVLLAALGAFQVLGLLVNRAAVEASLRASREAGLAERLVAIKRAVAGRPPSERDRLAHSLSSGGLDVHWSRASLVPLTSTPTARTRDLERRLRSLVPDLAAEAFRVGYADEGLDLAAGTPPPDGDPEAYRHTLLASIRLDDGSWLNASTPTLGHAAHFDVQLALVSVAVGLGIVLVALLLVRRITRPLTALALAAEEFRLEGGPQVPLSEDGPVEVRRAARAFNELRARIRRLVDERTQALAAVSHDLKTPITRLRLRAHLMDDDEARARVEADLDEMEAMIESTMAYLRGESDGEPARAVDLAALLQTICDEGTDAGDAVAFAGVRPATFHGRPVALKRAFGNLVGNGLKYGRSVRVALTRDEAAYLVAVTDDGPGIPPEERERVFEPFRRLEGSRSRETGGTGLGLTIARAVIEAHGGTVRLADAVPHGLEVWVRLPMQGLAAQHSVTMAQTAG